MSIRGNKERKEIDIVVADHREESENGVRTLLEGGFFEKSEENIPENYPGQSIYAVGAAYLPEKAIISGSAEKQVEQLREFFRLNAIRSSNMRSVGKVYTYDLDALTDIAAFLIGNSSGRAPMTVAIMKKGIEMTCAAEPAGYADKLMKGSLEEAMKKLYENGNGYPIVEYDSKEGELTAAIFIPKFFSRSEAEQNYLNLFTLGGVFLKGGESRKTEFKYIK